MEPFFVMGDLRHVRARHIEYFQGIPSDRDRDREIPHDREIQKIRAVVQLYDHFRDSYGEQSALDHIKNRASPLFVSSRKKLVKQRLRMQFWRNDAISQRDEEKARPTNGVDSARYLRKVLEPPRRLQQSISSDGFRHCGRGGRPPVQCLQVNG